MVLLVLLLKEKMPVSLILARIIEIVIRCKDNKIERCSYLERKIMV